MSKPNKCPPHLRLVTDRLADYISHHPKGITLDSLTKLAVYAKQNKKDRVASLAYLEETGVIHCQRDGGTCDWVYTHSKHYVPGARVQSQLAEQLQKVHENTQARLPPWKPEPEELKRLCMKCGVNRPLSHFGSESSETCTACLRLLSLNQPQTEDEPMAMNLDNMTPEAMLDLAKKLEQHAQSAKEQRSSKDEFNKQLAPLKAEVVKAHGAASRKFDEFVDAMAVLGDAVNRLANFKAD
ncbi:hypothetical protein [Citrobacter werkmanii]|uniref:hypothetical protein n=1 Tax=Citrobacter werkmanii TaxID=67827 RepID=UPI0037C8AF1D